MTLRLSAVALFAAVILSSSPQAAQTATATTSRSFTDTRSGLTVISAEIQLPRGLWDVATIAPAGTLDQVFVVTRVAPDAVGPARRVPASEVQRNLGQGQWHVSQFFMPVREYAGAHGGLGPKSFAELDATKFPYFKDAASRSPWSEDAGKPIPGPFFFLVPGVRVPVDGPAIPTLRVPLVFELRPYVGDGKHWVLHSDGHTARVDIDAALMSKYGLVVRPVRLNTTGRPPDSAALIPHTVMGVLRNPAAATATLTLVDEDSGKRTDVRWTLAGGRADRQVLSEWARIRESGWRALAEHGDAAVLNSWIARTQALYGGGTGAGARPEMPMGFDPRNMDRTPDTFGVLGGRAALRETLQMEVLRAAGPGARGFGAPDVAIGTLSGIEVKSLPFQQMLAGRPGGRIPLADRVPEDRLLVYFAKPAALFPFLDKGGDFLARAGSLYTASAFDDDLKGRYLRRLGLQEKLGRAFIESGGVTELALVASDLFFIDGTDVTMLMRIRTPEAVAGALRLLGIVDIAPQGITEKPTPAGGRAFWARQGDVLAVSTSRAEIERTLKLGADATGTGSLGRSAELRYLLTELPLKPETRTLVYMSDPFIRRMVGPALKIGQLRRMRARAEMVVITSGALLYRLDGHRDPPTLPRLLELGYVPGSINAPAYQLREDLTVVSRDWGTLADMTPIDTDAIRQVTAAEAEAYNAYMEAYRRYWRQFFDPIAMRLDDAPGGQLELSTFILPLVDSELYDGVRQFMPSRENGQTLRVPVLSPEPVAQISLNLTEQAWVGISGDWSRMFSEYSGISPEIFDLFGPGLHVAIQDADPIISTGTSDLLGVFASPMFGPRFDMMMPVVVSVLTRPSKIMLELTDPARARDLLRVATTRSAGTPMRMRESMEFRQIEGRDAWVYTFGVPGIVTLRLGIEIQNGYLVISNMPWSKAITVQRVDTQPLNGATIRVAPNAVKEGLPGLFATQAEMDQRSALASMAALLPLLQSGSATPDDAASRHAALFGSRPLHPGTGAWIWRNGQLESSTYGTATHWKLPLYRPELGNFGLFDGATLLDLNMQFESGGLRAVARWTWKD